MFWNTNKKFLSDQIFDLVEEHSVDLLFLAEHQEEKNEIGIVDKLRFLGDYTEEISPVFQKVRAIYDSSSCSCEEIYGHTRYKIYKVKNLNDTEFLIACVHFPSKLNWGNSSDHFGLCVQLRSDIETHENTLNIENTIIIGDFNMNPYEDGIFNAVGLGNVSSKAIAKNINRSIYNVKYKSFYNPMWSFFGDNSQGETGGTFYFNSSKYINQFWNMYDQVMIRPSLVECFEDDEFIIVNKIKGVSLLTHSVKGMIINKNISDHLPILAKFKTHLL